LVRLQRRHVTFYFFQFSTKNVPALTVYTFVNWPLGIAPLHSACQGVERTAPAAKPDPELPPAG
jgi:hypothetical protein